MFKVQKKMCDQCLFSSNRIVSATRFKSIVKECLKKDTHFICHKSTAKEASRDVCCRAFYDAYPTQMIRISHRLNMVEFVEVG